MPGPFPGMDPYLEVPRSWPGFHNRFLVTVASELNALLPPDYVALIEEWVYVMPARRRIQPDIAVTTGSPSPQRVTARTATLVADEPLIVEPREDKTRVVYVNIIRPGDAEDILTTIEMLSPANKRPGKDRRAYLRK